MTTAGVIQDGTRLDCFAALAMTAIPRTVVRSEVIVCKARCLCSPSPLAGEGRGEGEVDWEISSTSSSPPAPSIRRPVGNDVCRRDGRTSRRLPCRLPLSPSPSPARGEGRWNFAALAMTPAPAPSLRGAKRRSNPECRHLRQNRCKRISQTVSAKLPAHEKVQTVSAKFTAPEILQTPSGECDLKGVLISEGGKA